MVQHILLRVVMEELSLHLYTRAHKKHNVVTSFSVAVAVDKKGRFSVDNLVISVQLASCKLYTDH